MAYDLGGVFPTNDGIDPVTTDGTVPGYDLTQLLSDTMRVRPPWLALATVASQVLYERVENYRISFEASRDSNFIGRTLRILLLSMAGLRWNSDIITDDAYQRLVDNISLYNQSHGDSDFVLFIGYCLGFEIEMVTLWTTNYLNFVVGPQVDSIFDDPPGPWYPTSHVGLLYEEYAPNAPTPSQQDALVGIFYSVAPIHLVLEFIGTVVDLMVGPLVFAAYSS